MTDPKNADVLDYLSQLIAFAARPRRKIDLPSPGGVAGLRALGDRLFRLLKSPAVHVKFPEHTLIDSGGDWDDIAVLLMAAAKQAGIRTRISKIGSKFYVQAQQTKTDEWEIVGPAGSYGGA